MRDYGFQEPEEYFRAIHPEDEADCLNPDMVLKLILNNIPLPKAVLTNAPMDHAIRILDKLGISECFSGIYDIWFNKLVGKPHPRFLSWRFGSLGIHAGAYTFYR